MHKLEISTDLAT